MERDGLRAKTFDDMLLSEKHTLLLLHMFVFCHSYGLSCELRPVNGQRFPVGFMRVFAPPTPARSGFSRGVAQHTPGQGLSVYRGVGAPARPSPPLAPAGMRPDRNIYDSFC